jgi:hypothetical protein
MSKRNILLPQDLLSKFHQIAYHMITEHRYTELQMGSVVLIGMMIDGDNSW